MYPLFTAKKGVQLYGMFVFYCIVTFVLYRMVVNFVGIKFSWISLSFLSMIIFEVFDVVFK